MNPRKLIGSPVLLALITIFGPAIWAILGLFGAASTTMDLFGLLVVIAAGLSLVYMLKNVVKPPESKPLRLGLNPNGPPDDKQGQESGNRGKGP